MDSDLGRELSEEKDKGLVLQGKMEEVETKLQKDEEERRSLVQALREREEKVGELERRMKEKEMGLLRVSEEKREAIRQLSVMIEYHRNRYKDVKAMVAEARGGTREVAA